MLALNNGECQSNEDEMAPLPANVSIETYNICLLYTSRREKVKDIIIEQLQVDESEVTMDTNLMKDLSADSLDAVEIIMAIEDEYGIEIPDEEAEKFQTVRDLVKYVEEVK